MHKWTLSRKFKIDEYMNIQNIDLSKIICDKCKKNKSNIYRNEFYICNDCNMNLRPYCKSLPDNSYSIINYDSKNYIFNKHEKSFAKYCEDCKKDLRFLCLNEHNEYNIVNYKD